MNKKAQELTITTVVIAVLAILVLVVLFYIFTTKTGGLSKQLITCPGDCVDKELCESKGGTILPGDTYLNPVDGTECDVGTCCSVRIKIVSAE